MVLLAGFLGWMFDGMEMGIFPLVARPALQQMQLLSGAIEEGFVQHWMGIITGLFLLGAACGGLIFGWIGDRVGRVKAMTWSILCYSLFTGLCYFAAQPWQLGACRFVAALGMGGEWGLGVALVMEVWPENKRPLMAGLIGAAANLGYALIALIAIGFTITQTSWRWVMIVGATPALLTFVMRLFVPESKKWQASVKGGHSHPVREIFAPALRSRTVLAIAFASVPLIVTWGIVQWIPLWADHMTAGTQPKVKAYIQLVSSGGAVFGTLLAAFCGGYFGRRPTYCGLCLMSLCICTLLFRAFTQVTPAFFVMVGLAGFSTAAFYGWLPLYLPELFPTRVRATGQGLAFNFGRVLAALGAWQMGPLMAFFDKSYARAGATVVFVYLIGAAIIWLAPETKGKPLPE
jgi:MFS family permease